MEFEIFQDRRDAGERLAQALKSKVISNNAIVLGLPRGGVPVAAVVAQALGLPHNVLIVKKIGAPDQPEYAIGALAEQGEPFWNKEALSLRSDTPDDLAKVLKQTRERINLLSKRWRGDSKLSEFVQGREVLVVDDGLATGWTMLAAVRCLKRINVAKVIVAVPVGSQEGVKMISQEADEVITLVAPENFFSVSQWYQDFEQVSEDEVDSYLQ